MEYEKYFGQVLEFGELIREYYHAGEAQRAALGYQIQHSRFLAEYEKEQTRMEVNVLNKITCQTQRIKRDFVASMAVPGSDEPGGEERVQMPYHCHNYLELVYVLRGRYVQYINGIRHEHKAGEFCLLNPNVVHRDAVCRANDVILFFCMSPSYVYSDLAAYFDPHPELKAFMEYKLGRSARQYVLFAPAPETLAEAESVMEQLLKENHEKNQGITSSCAGWWCACSACWCGRAGTRCTGRTLKKPRKASWPTSPNTSAGTRRRVPAGRWPNTFTLTPIT